MMEQREFYDIDQYGKGSRKQKKDRLIREKFPDAVIHTLLGSVKLTKREKLMDNALGFLTDAPFGIPQMIHSVRNLDKEFYLVEKGQEQLLVVVTDEFFEKKQIDPPIREDRFEIGEWKFVKCTYQVKG